jgi:hypothetical protein
MTDIVATSSGRRGFCGLAGAAATLAPSSLGRPLPGFSPDGCGRSVSMRRSVFSMMLIDHLKEPLKSVSKQLLLTRGRAGRERSS